MRDLYKRLTLSPTVEHQALNEALTRCPNSALRQDAEATLGVTDHREQYDALHHTLSDIGRLRAQLGLNHAPNWHGDVANDFSQPPNCTQSSHDELVERVSHAVKLYNRWQRWRGPWLFIAVFVAGAGVGLAGGFALSLGPWAG